MLFGGINGLNIFNPLEIEDNKYVPPIVITNFEIFNKVVAVKEGSILEQSINFIKDLNLNYDQNVISFQYSALNFNAPEKNQYAYFLENFDKAWNYVDNKRNISYTNLDPGEYVLNIRGSNNDGLWNEEGAKLKIIIIPSYWRTWWFYSLSALLALSIFYIIIKLRLRALKKDKETIRQTLQQSLDNAHTDIERQKKAIEEEQLKTFERNWIDQSVSLMSETLSKSKNDVTKLCESVLSGVVKRCELYGGAIYVYNNHQEEFIRKASYAMNNVKDVVSLNSGLIGECFEKRETIILSNVPENYFQIESGLGGAPLKWLLLIPLQYEDICVGVIELPSFTEFIPYRVQFIEALAAQIAAAIHTTEISERTTQLLEESKIQENEMKVREEEMKGL